MQLFQYQLTKVAKEKVEHNFANNQIWDGALRVIDSSAIVQCWVAEAGHRPPESI